MKYFFKLTATNWTWIGRSPSVTRQPLMCVGEKSAAFGCYRDNVTLNFANGHIRIRLQFCLCITTIRHIWWRSNAFIHSHKHIPLNFYRCCLFWLRAKTTTTTKKCVFSFFFFIFWLKNSRHTFRNFVRIKFTVAWYHFKSYGHPESNGNTIYPSAVIWPHQQCRPTTKKE